MLVSRTSIDISDIAVIETAHFDPLHENILLGLNIKDVWIRYRIDKPTEQSAPNTRCAECPPGSLSAGANPILDVLRLIDVGLILLASKCPAADGIFRDRCRVS